MQELQASVHNQSPSLPDGTLPTVHALFTPLRVGLVLAAALLIATAITILRADTAGQPSGDVKREQSLIGHTTASEASGQGPESSTSTSFSSATTGGSTSTSLTVNGHDVPVPADGNTHQTTIDQNGTSTSVNASASQSSTTNTSTINVHIHSNASATGENSR